uniref:hypothetical protein n=1 Tax=Clostridium weizhouense TaxID=2859781 RepID=UPI0027E4A533|nr:hypothetical protein [Clostridium weizhouense]
MKNDKKYTLSIATIGKFQNIKLSQGISLDIFLLKNLIREYYKLTDTCSVFKKKLSSDLRVIFPSYNTVFSNIITNNSIGILKRYPTPQSVLEAPNKIFLISLLTNLRKVLYSLKKYIQS